MICSTLHLQEWHLYKYIESESKELVKDLADPNVKRSALTIMCRAERRFSYYIWNIFSITVSEQHLSFEPISAVLVKLSIH